MSLPEDPVRAGAVLLLLTLAVASAVYGASTLRPDGSTGDARPATTIDSCTEITESGRYVLDRNLTDRGADTCIRIQADDVVLAGGGHRVDGRGTFGTAGVVVRADGDEPASNVTVRNVTVTDWDDGIRYIGVDGGAVVDATTATNRVGLSLLNARDVHVADNVARGNRLRGISLLESGANNTLANNTATDNALYGIHLVEGGVRDNTLVNNVASNNEFGIVLIGVHDNAVTRNVASGNRIAGVWLSASTGNRLHRNRVSNRFYGIFLADRSNGNVVSNTVAASNEVGVRLRSSDDNRIADNAVRGSGDTAILLISSDGNEVVGNVGLNNARGVSLVRSSGNRVANNSLGG
ncbi:right-handed parallel beta-helix repeat-containing protein [Halorarum halobium]|uniref:right-handed parallel beta-helix repeat-containing protein n=1 Tax=Halorarum halobium TaxID=3075121 RepID=UPI0028A7231B|nr:right-handed parallel beta-helix repeat-containing protein [Halobaculum sp. XH14]